MPGMPPPPFMQAGRGGREYKTTIYCNKLSLIAMLAPNMPPNMPFPPPNMPGAPPGALGGMPPNMPFPPPNMPPGGLPFPPPFAPGPAGSPPGGMPFPPPGQGGMPPGPAGIETSRSRLMEVHPDGNGLFDGLGTLALWEIGLRLSDNWIPLQTRSQCFEATAFAPPLRNTLDAWA